ncbi:MAG: hypothetical protein V3U47_08000, partial [Acidimicrobiia bacterium]
TMAVEVDLDGVIRPPGTDAPAEEGSDDDGGTGDEVLLPPHLRPPVDPLPDNEPVAVPEPAPSAALDPTVSHIHKVVRGEHLWRIASQHLEVVSGRTNLAEREIAPYWVRVMEANRSTIRSGDPDLIYPGEQIVLPPVEV